MQNMGSSSFSPYVLVLLIFQFIFVSSASPSHATNQDISDQFRSLNGAAAGTAKFPRRRPPPTLGDLSNCTDYINLTNTNGEARIFYYLSKSKRSHVDKNAPPLVVYLMGGPGYSGSMGMFYENGPFKLKKDLSLEWNYNSWNMEADLLIPDQPIGTGFSYSTNDTDIPTTSESAAVQMYNFLQIFLANNPTYAKRRVYLTGESYAGHYVPTLADRIVRENKNSERTHINLAGMAIGSPWVNPSLMFPTYPEFALSRGLVNQTQYRNMSKSFSNCQRIAHEICDVPGSKYNVTACADVYLDCGDVFWINIIGPMINKTINYYDITKKCITSDCYDFSNVDRFLNISSVKIAMKVDPMMQFDKESDLVYAAMLGEQMRSSADVIANLLKENGIKLLIYVGQNDLICNEQGNLKWVNDMKYKGFSAARPVAFKVDGVDVGWLKTSRNLSFLSFKKAGHMIPMDQPKGALQMITKWMDGSLH